MGGCGIYGEVRKGSTILDIYNNSAAGNGADIFIYNPDNTAVNIKKNDFSPDVPKKFYIENNGNLSQTNNLNNIDPLFTGPVIDDYRLISDSPLIDQRDNLAPAVSFEDPEGIPRPANG